MGSLWPESFNTNKRTPKFIVEEQIKLLPKLTGDMVFGQVSQANVDLYAFCDVDKDEKKNLDLKYAFMIGGKFLEVYRFVPLYFAHSIALYPVIIFLENDIYQELYGRTQAVMGVTVAEDEIRFTNLLEGVLKSNKMRSVIEGIISLSR